VSILVVAHGKHGCTPLFKAHFICYQQNI